MRNFAALFLAAVFGSVFALGATYQPYEPSFELRMRAEAAPTVRLMKAANGSCSAVVVAPGYALTALHCEQAFEPKVDGHPVKEWRKFSAKDVALLVVPGLQCPCANVAFESSFEVDEPVAAIGFPGGIGLLLSYGNALDFVLFQDEVYLHTSTMLAGGMSGGGVFVIREGRAYLLAIISRGTGPSSLSVPTAGLIPDVKGL